ncbi:MAG: excinuclease ABC subunit C [Candidatus Wildermuthbacteria bacterium RIFCSPHIGHO2_12_FULL_40_12]|uniref:Excinuclease ABC subunit C n=1 Tax=Candidatus Wildermuthbacteria bacterium RIFCSPHIGHO2_12_FULL_40_12 TaxID=1802457 RepID=A0A1G2RE67_9BACT|nr:MAG: excinuclease ABC subunit C [Candidatus Wildermuthbacteria bacterium RIFCSPHIGHO2_12_FULL_40_12]
MFYTYILRSIKNNDLYIGYTSNLKKRLIEHNRGVNFSTKHNKPWKLIYYEACINKNDAKRREEYFKTSQGRRLLKRRLKDYFYATKN